MIKILHLNNRTNGANKKTRIEAGLIEVRHEDGVDLAPRAGIEPATYRFIPLQFSLPHQSFAVWTIPSP
jgi:hypothetical protein